LETGLKCANVFTASDVIGYSWLLWIHVNFSLLPKASARSIAYLTSRLAPQNQLPVPGRPGASLEKVRRNATRGRRYSAGGGGALLDVMLRHYTSSSSSDFEIKIEGGLSRVFRRREASLMLYAARRFGNPSKISLSEQLLHYETLSSIIYARAEVCYAKVKAVA